MAVTEPPIVIKDTKEANAMPHLLLFLEFFERKRVLLSLLFARLNICEIGSYYIYIL
jgi:hypothetical protein